MCSPFQSPAFSPRPNALNPLSPFVETGGHSWTLKSCREGGQEKASQEIKMPPAWGCPSQEHRDSFHQDCHMLG